MLISPNAASTSDLRKLFLSSPSLTQNFTVAAKAQAVAITGARSALALLGGPSGVLLLAAAGVYALYQAMSNKSDIEQYKKDIDDAANRVRNLTQAQADAAGSKTQIKLDADTKSLKDAKEKLSDLESALALFQKGGASAAIFGDPTQKAKEFSDKINIARESIQSLESEVSKGTAFISLFSQQAKNAGDTSTESASANEIYEKSTKSLAESNELLANTIGKSLAASQEMAAEKELRRTLEGNGISAEETERQVKKLKDALAERSELTFEQEMKSVQSNVEALRIEMTQGKEAAIAYRASIDASNKGYSADQVKEYVAAKQQELKVTQQIADQNKKSSARASSSKRDENAAESVAQKLANLRQQSELAAESTRELSREQAILTAQQSLGSAATASDIALARKYAAAKWDVGNAIRAQAAAEKLIPEKGENSRYRQETKDLQTALNANKITQDQYNSASERSEQEHQDNLAKIRADAAVSPKQQSAGLVDPVQQLANENARKLALIQQFEKDKTITEQQGIALRNAANTQFEQQRIAAQWEIWRQQSVGNEVAAAAFDSFAGNASNALTGILTGSMSVSDAMRSLGATVLNSVINSFVQMGVEWAKSVIMGQVGMTAAAAVASAQGVAIAAAMAPAAAMTSLATSGANAIPAQAGIGATVGVAQGLAIAGARKNGGPVSAGEMYRVGEGGMPELYKASTGKQYMIPGDNGKVISNKDMQTAGGGGGVVVNIQNYTSSNVDAQATQGENGVTIDVIVADISNGGRIGQAISSFHQAPRRATQ